MLEKKIKFTSPLKGFIPEPKPSKFFIPNSFKKMIPFLDSQVNSTVKKCIPFLDAFTTGYIIPFPTDIEYLYNIETKKGQFSINCKINNFENLIGISDHSQYQVAEELRDPKRTIDNIFKFHNPWTIKTPPGYSCLFVKPFNHTLPFNLVTGVVDTDTYPLPILFPFYWINDASKRVILESGSPMAMVFPFKRENWKMSCKVSDVDNTEEQKKHVSWFGKISDNYKNIWWKKKFYK